MPRARSSRPAPRRAYDLLCAGVSPDSIAGTWNAAALPAAPDGTPAAIGIRGEWTGDKVRAVLADPGHVGRTVDGPTFRRAVDLLAAAPRRDSAEPDRALLTAIADCGLCGAPSARPCWPRAGPSTGATVAASASTWPAASGWSTPGSGSRCSRPARPARGARPAHRAGLADLHALRAHSAGLRTRLDQVEDGSGSLGTELATVEAEMADHAVRDVPSSITGARPAAGGVGPARRVTAARRAARAGRRVEPRPSMPGRRASDGDAIGQSVRIRWRAPG